MCYRPFNEISRETYSEVQGMWMGWGGVKRKRTHGWFNVGVSVTAVLALPNSQILKFSDFGKFLKFLNT